ncbi:MAG TPA: hypothetical protein EYP10_10835 [Armatimonadetes bacterium]|nr:hypothetical protein [Armatimonadota bacterium]
MYIELLTDSQLEQLRDGVLHTLESVGMVFQNERILNALSRMGASIDYANETAKFPRRLVEAFIEDCQRQVAHATARKPKRFEPPPLPFMGVQVAQFYFDYECKERRAGRRQDFITMIHFADALEPGRAVGHCLLMSDIPHLIEPLEAVALLIEHAHKPGYTYPHYIEQFDYLADIGEIYCGDRNRFLIGGIFITSPLRVCKRAADFLVKKIDLGLPCGVGTMPVMGASAPVTYAGAIVVASAEIIGTWMAIRALNEGAELNAGIGAGSIDMRTGNATFCSPEAMLYNFATVEFFRKVTGKKINVAGGSDYTDARMPGLYAAFEKATKAMMVACFTGRHPGAGQGMLESGKTLSPEQLLLDREMTEMVRLFAEPIEVNAETLALDAIEQVGIGLHSSYLESEHTLKWHRSALWQPRFLDRSVWEGFERERAKEEAAVERAHATFKETLTRYQPPQVDERMLRDIHSVIERARRNLL